MEPLLIMRNEEIDKLRVIREIIDGKLSWREASERLQVSVRQVGYLCAQVREQGNRGIIHGLRGKPSNHRLDLKLVEEATEWCGNVTRTLGRPWPMRSCASGTRSRFRPLLYGSR
jgi:Helix-turn-helix domain